MLSRLDIRGLAIVEALSIDFARGFNVVTGETGAGKSIIIKALNLALGGKGSVDDIRRTSQEATVVAEFELGCTHPAIEFLTDLGITTEEVDDNHVVVMLRRQLQRTGRSSAWVNDCPITIASLKELGAYLVDVCAQHDNQKLLNPREHARFLDSFLKDPDLVEEFEQVFDECEKRLTELSDLNLKVATELRERDYLEFRLQEIDALNPSEEDFVALKEFLAQAERLQAEREKMQRAVEIMDGGSERYPRPLTDALGEVRTILSTSRVPDIQVLAAVCEQAIQAIDDIGYNLTRLIGSERDDEPNIAEARARLDSYHELKFKLRVSDVADIIKEYEALRAKQLFFLTVPSQAKAILAKFCELVELAEALGAGLSQQRKKASKKVELSVKNEFSELNMTGASLKVEFSATCRELSNSHSLDGGLVDAVSLNQYQLALEKFSGLSRRGAESARFMFISNPGETAKPLHQIASGGEISRIVLALKNALAVGAQTCVLVFDEIDTGISGKVADLVGRKLKHLGSRFQIICVSHLPQVAAYADRHFVVEKVQSKGKTESIISRVEDHRRAEEIARLLSGDRITSESLQNANSLMKKSLTAH